MSKYNFRVDEIDPNSTHGRILSKINPGSTVLEMGCATGYMTKYMKEQLNCAVDIVEIDDDACGIASQYARNSLCCDLSKMFWREKFDQERYDYILFADVLEHLVNPMTVLKSASELLKPEGQIIITIPNICHNDIMIRMFYDLFTYTDMGLLDCTHIHFWGLRDFVMQCEQIGLHAKECNCILRETSHTEQALPAEDVDPDLLEVLKKRDFGEVYQYLFVCVKKE